MRAAREIDATEANAPPAPASGEQPRGTAASWSVAPRESGVIARRDGDDGAKPRVRLKVVAGLVFVVGLAAGQRLSVHFAPRLAALPTRVAARVRARRVATVRTVSPVVAAPASPQPAIVEAHVAAVTTAVAPAPAEPPSGAAPAARQWLTATEVLAEVHAHDGRIRDCAHRARRYGPDVAGRVRVKLFISPDGHVRDAVWTRANTPQTHALGCITEAMRSWSFGPTGYDTDFVAYVPLEF